MTPEHLANHYLGELANESRIVARALNSANNRNVVLTALRNTDRDDDVYLAALAREWVRLDKRAAHDQERVEAQKLRFGLIRRDVRQLSFEDECRFWDTVHAVDPVAPSHQIGGRRYTKRGTDATPILAT